MIKKLLKSESVLYLIFGGFTTVVNFAVYYGFTYFTGVHYLIANAIAWIAAVVFAYITNRIFVFRSSSKGKEIFVEIYRFFAARVASLVIEAVLIKLLVDVIGYSEKSLIVKLGPAVFVVISNYFFSKFVIFRKKTTA